MIIQDAKQLELFIELLDSYIDARIELVRYPSVEARIIVTELRQKLFNMLVKDEDD